MLQVGKDRVCDFLPAVRRKRRRMKEEGRKKSEQESGLNPLELCLDEE